jgi:putative peptidoglycan lipid II flippase
MLAAPVITGVFAPGFIGDSEKFDLTSEMIRITFPYLMLISMTGFCGDILNSYGRFAVPAFTPVFLNISLIFAALVAAPWFDEPVFALAWGVLFAGIVQLLFQLPSLYRLDLVPRPIWDTSDRGVRRILKLMVPALFGVSVSQINLLLDTVLASFLPTGSISWLYYSDRLAELPLGIFGIAIATVILPNLSAHRAAAREADFSATLDWALRWVLLIGVPSAIALILLAEPILITLFKYGALTTDDVEMSALSLRAYSLGLIAFMLVKVLAPGFYARKDTVTPVKIGIVAMVANMIMNFLLTVPLMYYWNIGHMGLALATSMAAVLNALMLFRGLKRAGFYQPHAGWGVYLLRLCLASGVLVAVILWLAPDQQAWLGWQWQRRAFELAVICSAGVVVYFFAHAVVGTRMLHLRVPTPR